MRQILKKLSFQRSPRPYYFPVWGRGVPIYDWNTILLNYAEIPRDGVLPFDQSKTIIMVESGGLAVTTAPRQDVCLERQSVVDPDIVFQLDYPLKVKVTGYSGRTKDWTREWYYGTPEGQKQRTITMNIQNAREAMMWKEKNGRDFDIMGIIHAYDRKSLIFATSELVSLGYDVFGLGAKHFIHPTREGWVELENHMVVRDIIGKHAWLHALGITDPKYLVHIKGLIDSFDSASSLFSANKGVYITPDNKRISIAVRMKTDKGFSASLIHMNPEVVKMVQTNDSLVDDPEILAEVRSQVKVMQDAKTGTDKTFILKTINHENLIRYWRRIVWN